MRFGIVIKIDRRSIRLQAERIYLSDNFERYEIKGRNRSLTIQSNRPLLRKKGIRYRRPDYKLIAGIIHTVGITDKIIEALHNFITRSENE